MMCLVLRPFRLQRQGRVALHKPGEKVRVKISVVPPLVNGGFVRLLEPLDKVVEPVAARIYSRILDDEIWVVTHPEAMSLVPPGEVVYLPEEIRGLRGASPEDIKAVHRVKRELGGELIAVMDRKDGEGQ